MAERLNLPRPLFLDSPTRKWAEDLIRALEQRFAQDERGTVRRENMRTDVKPIGDKNGGNTEFVVPHRFLIDEAGAPVGALFWKTGFLTYTVSLTPGAGEWTVVDGIAGKVPGETTIRMGDAPLAGDELVFPMLVSV